jgi:hypothetical protein
MLIADRPKPFPKADIAHDEKSLAQWCRWWRDGAGEVEGILEEQVIDTLAWSCVNLRRVHRG